MVMLSFNHEKHFYRGAFYRPAEALATELIIGRLLAKFTASLANGFVRDDHAA